MNLKAITLLLLIYFYGFPINFDKVLISETL